MSGYEGLVFYLQPPTVGKWSTGVNSTSKIFRFGGKSIIPCKSLQLSVVAVRVAPPMYDTTLS